MQDDRSAGMCVWVFLCVQHKRHFGALMHCIFLINKHCQCLLIYILTCILCECHKHNFILIFNLLGSIFIFSAKMVLCTFFNIPPLFLLLMFCYVPSVMPYLLFVCMFFFLIINYFFTYLANDQWWFVSCYFTLYINRHRLLT